MTDGVEIKISGLDDINKALFKYSQQLGDTVALRATREGAKVVQKEARKRAPRSTPERATRNAGKRGRLRRAIVVKNSKIHSPRRNGSKIGVYLTIRKGKGKDDPKDGYYGRWQEDGWNTHGKRNATRQSITSIFGSRTGRKTGKGRFDKTGKKFMKSAFKAKRGKAVKTIILAAERAAEIIAKKTGL